MNNRDSNSSLVQWEKRVILFKYIYSQLLKNEPIAVAKQKFFDYFGSIDANFVMVLEYFLDNKEFIIKELSKNLQPNWTFDRLNFVDQAILIEAYSEYKTLNVDKAVIIDQAIISCKKYSDPDNYEYINAILDKTL